jgi:hypothetical protein
MKNNVIVMSEAGKPIFARHGSEEEISRQCGLFQAIRTAVNGNQALNLGEIQSLRSEKLCIVFMSVASITLVSISKVENEIVETEAFARLQLEYIFAQLIFTLTEQVQNIFIHNPGFDLRTMLTSSDSLMHGILDDSGPDGNAGPYLVAGVQSFFPISRSVRDKASRVLQSIGGKIENTAFALLVVGGKLLSLVQPAFRPHQMRTPDLHLILNFIGKQPGLVSSELWVPMCLPRFNSSGFLYAYTNCFDVASKLTLILISSHNTTEQFQLFRDAASRIRDALGVPAQSDSVITIQSDKKTISDHDVEWTRSDESFDCTEEDYVNVLSDGDRRKQDNDRSLLREVRESLQLSTFDKICREYSEEDYSLIHFLFRVDIAVKNCSRQSSPGRGHLTQCISPPVSFPFVDAPSRRRLWTNYQKLSLRLRLGSATVESSMDAFDMISQDETASGLEGFPGIAKHCPAIGLVESPPNLHGVTYIVEESEIFLAMNGRDFEL